MASNTNNTGSTPDADVVKNATQMNWDDEDEDYGSEDDMQIGDNTAKAKKATDEVNDTNEEQKQDQVQQQDQEEQKSNHGGQTDAYENGGYNNRRNNRGYNDNQDQRSNYSHQKGDYPNRRNNQRKNYRGSNRDNNREDNPDYFDASKVNENSNYRQFYCRDPKFFLKVISKEEPPFLFKIHAFEKNNGEENEEKFRNELEIKVFQKISGFDAQNCKSHSQNERLRFTFEINEQEKAISLFEEISNQPRHVNPRMAIFLLKPEEIFEKYADEEAELYYAEQKKYQEKLAERPDKFNDRQDNKGKGPRNQQNRNRDGRYKNDTRSNASNDAFIEQMSFRKNQGPPQFTSSKPKRDAEPANTENQGATASHRVVTQTSTKPATEAVEEVKNVKNSQVTSNHRTVTETKQAPSGTESAVNQGNSQNKKPQYDEAALEREYEEDRKKNSAAYEAQYDEYYPEDDSHEFVQREERPESQQSTQYRPKGRGNNRGGRGGRGGRNDGNRDDRRPQYQDKNSNYQDSKHGDDRSYQNNDRSYRNDNRRNNRKDKPNYYNKQEEEQVDWSKGTQSAKQYDQPDQREQKPRQPRMQKFNSAYDSQKGDDDQRSYVESDRQSQQSRGGRGRGRSRGGRGGRGRGDRDNRDSAQQQYQEVDNGRKQGGANTTGTNVVKKQYNQGSKQDSKAKQNTDPFGSNRFQMFAK